MSEYHKSLEAGKADCELSETESDTLGRMFLSKEVRKLLSGLLVKADNLWNSVGAKNFTNLEEVSRLQGRIQGLREAVDFFTDVLEEDEDV